MEEIESSLKIKQPPVLFKKTQEIIHQMEKLLDAPVITYWNSSKGSICHSDVVALYSHLEKIGKVDLLYFFIKSGGGNGQASLRIMNLMRQYAKEIRMLVPLECSSAATMISLGANEIHMGPMAYLSAVDTSLTHDLSPLDRDNNRVSISLDELNRVIKRWHSEKADKKENPYKELYSYIHPLVIGAVDRADCLSTMLCKELLSHHLTNESKISEISETLNTKYPSHGYPILADEAHRMGLTVKKMDKAVHHHLLDLNAFYSEMGQKATTDFSEIRSHSNEIYNIIESNTQQVYFQTDKDWFYRAEERRWIALNDNSVWHKVERQGERVTKSVFHI